MRGGGGGEGVRDAVINCVSVRGVRDAVSVLLPEQNALEVHLL